MAHGYCSSAKTYIFEALSLHMQKILVIRFSSIGDIVLTTPVLRCLKKQKGFTVHVLTKPEYALLFDGNPYVDQVHQLDRSIRQKALQLRDENYSVVIDLHHNLRTLIFKQTIGLPGWSFPKRNIEKWLMVRLKINRLPQQHIVDRYMKTVEALGVINDMQGLDYFIPYDTDVSEYLPAEKYICWAIGAQHFTKKLPNEKIIRVCRELHLPVLILGGKEDELNGELITRAAGGCARNLCGKLGLHQSALLVKNSLLLLSNDTGMMHIGAALQKPVISFWGNTIPQFGMTPYYGASTVRSRLFEMENLSCRPCSKIGYNKCPKEHFNCMTLLNESEILKTVLEFC